MKTKDFARLCDRMVRVGLSVEETAALVRSERALHRWSERQCNEDIEVDDDGRAWLHWRDSWGRVGRYRIPNPEPGALRRASAIAAAHGLDIYQQGDPRGCALYLLRPGDVPDGEDVNAWYSRGLAIC